MNSNIEYFDKIFSNFCAEKTVFMAKWSSFFMNKKEGHWLLVFTKQ